MLLIFKITQNVMHQQPHDFPGNRKKDATPLRHKIWEDLPPYIAGLTEVGAFMAQPNAAASSSVKPSLRTIALSSSSTSACSAAESSIGVSLALAAFAQIL